MNDTTTNWKQRCRKTIQSFRDAERQGSLKVSEKDVSYILNYANSYDILPKKESISDGGKVFLDCVSLLANFCIDHNDAEDIDSDIYLPAAAVVGKLLQTVTAANNLKSGIGGSAILSSFVSISEKQVKNNYHRRMLNCRRDDTILYLHLSLGITRPNLLAYLQETTRLLQDQGCFSFAVIMNKCCCNYVLICYANEDEAIQHYAHGVLQLSLCLLCLEEYERAALACMEILGYIPDAKPKKFDIYSFEGLKPLGKGYPKDEEFLAKVRIIFARTLSYISNRCETVARADVPPYALKRVVEESAKVVPKSGGNDYHVFASILRKIAITELNRINSLDDKANTLARQLMGFLKLAQWEDSAKQVGERDSLTLVETYLRCLDDLSSSSGRVSAALALKALLVKLSTQNESIDTDDEERLRLLIARFDGRYTAQESEDPFLSAFFNDYAALLKMCSRLLVRSQDLDEDGRGQVRKLLLEAIRVAVCSIEIRRSRRCGFPSEEDYISSMPSERKKFYIVFNDILNSSNSPWKNSIDFRDIKKDFRQALKRCDDEQPIQTRSKVAYYTTLNTAQYLFDTLYCIDGMRHPVSKSEASRLLEPDKLSNMRLDDGKGKNCLTVMHASYMNDPYEGISLLRHLRCEALRPFLSDWQDVQTRIVQGSMTFVKSFTTLYDQLHMWSLYGSDMSAEGDCDGCCVCFSRDMFVQKRSSGSYRATDASVNGGEVHFPVDDHNLYRVVYMDEKDVPTHPDSEEENLLWCLNEIKNSLEAIDKLIKEEDPDKLMPDIPLPSFGLSENEIRNYLIDVLTPTAFLIKDASYSKEEEIRLLLRRDLSDGSDSDICSIPGDPSYRSKICVKPFEQIYIDRIILGPKFPNPHEVIPQLMIKLADMKKKAVENGMRMEGAVRLSRINYQ